MRDARRLLRHLWTSHRVWKTGSARATQPVHRSPFALSIVAVALMASMLSPASAAEAQESGTALAPPRSPDEAPSPSAGPPPAEARVESAVPAAVIPPPPGAEPAVELDPALVIPESVPEAAPEPPPGADALAAPNADREVAARLLQNLALAEEALARERTGADWTMAIAVNLYVGGAMLGLLSISLIVGVILEAVCFNGIPDECTDGPAFITGAIPSAIGAVSLMIGAYTTEQRARARHETLDLRRDGIESQRREVESRLSLSISPFGATLTF